MSRDDDDDDDKDDYDDDEKLMVIFNCLNEPRLEADLRQQIVVLPQGFSQQKDIDTVEIPICEDWY